MYPIHYPTLKIEEAEWRAEAARHRLAATAGRRWWSWRSRPEAAPSVPARHLHAVPRPAPAAASTPGPTVAAPTAAAVAAERNDVLVGR